MLRKTTANYQYLILQAVPTSQNRKELQGHFYMYETYSLQNIQNLNLKQCKPHITESNRLAKLAKLMNRNILQHIFAYELKEN